MIRQRPTDGAPPAVDPATGEVVGAATTTDTGTGTQSADFAAPTELASSRSVDAKTFGWVAALLLVAMVLLPGLMTASFRRRHPQGGPR